MVRRAPFPRRSLPANIELFNEAIVCVCRNTTRCLALHLLYVHDARHCKCISLVYMYASHLVKLQKYCLGVSE